MELMRISAFWPCRGFQRFRINELFPCYSGWEAGVGKKYAEDMQKTSCEELGFQAAGTRTLQR